MLLRKKKWYLLVLLGQISLKMTKKAFKRLLKVNKRQFLVFFDYIIHTGPKKAK